MPVPAQGHSCSGLAPEQDTALFELDGGLTDAQPDFELEAPVAESALGPAQTELWLPDSDPEHPQPSPQLELDGMAPPLYHIRLDDGREARFQHAANLLSSLEAQNIDVHFQCREGYCGSCRAQLLDGEVHYAEEPMAWLNEGEILLCCCIPRSNLHIRLQD